MKDTQQDSLETFLEDEAFAELEKAGRVELSISQRAELNAAISYCVRLRDWHEAYSRDALEARDLVATKSVELKAALIALDEPTYLSVVLSDDEGQVHFMEPNASSAAPDHFLEQLDAMHERSKLTAPVNLVRRHGHPKDAHLENLLRAVAKIYEKAGGRAAIGGKRTGPFGRFVRCLNNFIPRDYRAASGDALAKQAQQTLKRMKERAERIDRSKLEGPIKSR